MKTIENTPEITFPKPILGATMSAERTKHQNRIFQEIQQKLREANKSALISAIRAWGDNSDDWGWSDQGMDTLKLARTPVYQLSICEILWLFEAVAASERTQAAVAPFVKAQDEQLLAAIEGSIPLDREGRLDWGVRLVSYTSALFIPSTAFLGSYSLGLNAAEHLVNRILGKRFHQVLGAGTRGVLPPGYSEPSSSDPTEAALTYRYLMLAPLLASLTVFYPQPSMSIDG